MYSDSIQDALAENFLDTHDGSNMIEAMDYAMCELIEATDVDDDFYDLELIDLRPMGRAKKEKKKKSVDKPIEK